MQPDGGLTRLYLQVLGAFPAEERMRWLSCVMAC